MARRKALTDEAIAEEDLDMRAKIIASLPRCIWDPSAGPEPGSLEACMAERKYQVARAMDIADPAARGRALAAAPVCKRVNDPDRPVVESEAAPPPEPEPEPVRRFEIGATGGFSLWSGPPNLPAALGGFVEADIGYRIDVERSWLAFIAHGSLTGTTDGGDTYDASVTDVGVRYRLRWNRTALGFAAGYASARMVGTGKAVVGRTDSLGVVSADFSLAVVGLGPVRIELVAVVGIASRFDYASTTGRLGVTLRL